MALHCFLADYLPVTIHRGVGQGWWEFGSYTPFGGLSESPEMATVSGPEKVPRPEKVPLHFDGLRALGLAKERNLLGPLKPEDSFLDRTVANML